MKKTYDKNGIIGSAMNDNSGRVNQKNEQGGDGQQGNRYVQLADEFIHNAKELIHSRETRATILRMLEKPGDAVEIVKNAVLEIIAILEASAKRHGQQIDPIVVALSAPELLHQMVEIADAAGVWPADLDDDAEKVALAAAAQEYIKRARAEGRISQQDLIAGGAMLAKKFPGEVEQFDEIMGRYRAKIGGHR